MEVLVFLPSGNISKRAHIRGSMRRKVWLSVGDIVLLSIRDYQDTICDIVLKYSSAEARILKSKNQIPDTTQISADADAISFETENDEMSNSGSVKDSKSDVNNDSSDSDDSRSNNNELELDDL